MSKTIDQLKINRMPSKTDKVLISHNGETMAITIYQLLGLQQAAMNKPCKYCGSTGKFDVRGNCGSCGAPLGNL